MTTKPDDPVFAVRTAKGPCWDHGRGNREQAFWDEHASFADRLVERGVILLGGPIASDDAEDIARWRCRRRTRTRCGLPSTPIRGRCTGCSGSRTCGPGRCGSTGDPARSVGPRAVSAPWRR